MSKILEEIFSFVEMFDSEISFVNLQSNSSVGNKKLY